MIHRCVTRHAYFIFLFLFLTLLNISLSATEVIEVEGKIEDVNVKILKALNNISSDSVYSEDKTKGFSYRYTDRWTTPYDFDIYLGKQTKRPDFTIIRLESGLKGQAKVFRRIIEGEFLKNPDAFKNERKLAPKSYVISMLLAVTIPAASVGYNSYNSPFYYGSDTGGRMSLYILSDIALFATAYLIAANKPEKKTAVERLFSPLHPPWIKAPETPPYGKYEGLFIAAIAIPRMVRAFGSVQDTAAHNNMTTLGYSFQY